MKIDIALLQSAVKKYIKTFEHHTANPLSAEALHAWDAADAELSAVINNDEINIIISLLKQLEAAQKERDELRAEQKEHDGQIAEMEGKIQIRNTGLRLKTELYEKAEAALSAANEKLSKPVVLPDDGLEDCINMWPDNWRNDFDTGYNFGIWRCEQNIKAAGFTVEE